MTLVSESLFFCVITQNPPCNKDILNYRFMDYRTSKVKNYRFIFIESWGQRERVGINLSVGIDSWKKLWVPSSGNSTITGTSTCTLCSCLSCRRSETLFSPLRNWSRNVLRKTDIFTLSCGVDPGIFVSNLISNFFAFTRRVRYRRYLIPVFKDNRTVFPSLDPNLRI